LKLGSHLIEFAYVSPSTNEIFGLDFACSNLAIFGALFDVLDQLLLLVLEFGPLAVQLALRFFEGSLMFPQTLSRRHALAKGPFDNLPQPVLVGVCGLPSNTHIHGDLVHMYRRGGSEWLK
jgi:hypothetical protein